MEQPKTVQIFLEGSLRESAQSGQHNFINKVARVLERAQIGIEYRDIADRYFAEPSILSLTHMKSSEIECGLTFRRVYHYPFWQIESTSKRWDWDVAKNKFDPQKVEPNEANRFYNFWRKRLFSKTTPADNDGFIYMPLQGRLSDHRSFQSCSPIEMIERTLSALPNRKVVVTLHPKETYSQQELDQVERLERTFANLDLRTGQMEALLDRCACVVTQNSSAAFNGYFFGKPAVLFGKVDFHHIALDGMAPETFEQVDVHQPDYARYIHWFWQNRSINAGHHTAEKKIHERFVKHGWIK